MIRTPARLCLAAALVVGAVLFVIGTRGETHTTQANSSAATTTTLPTTAASSSQATIPSTTAAPTTTTRPPEGSPEREAQERGATATPPTVESPTTLPGSTVTSTSQPAEGTPEREAAEGTPGHVETAAEQSNEKILGINPESGGIIAGVVIVSIALALLALVRRSRVALWVAAGFCALAAAADLHELRLQVDRSKTGLAVIAATVAAVHIIGAIAGAVASRQFASSTH